MGKDFQSKIYEVMDEILKDYFTYLRSLAIGKEKAEEERLNGSPNWIEW